MNKRLYVNCIIVLLYSFAFNSSVFSHTILLKNGRKVIEKNIWEDGDSYAYIKYGATIRVAKKDIEKIEWEKEVRQPKDQSKEIQYQSRVCDCECSNKNGGKIKEYLQGIDLFTAYPRDLNEHIERYNEGFRNRVGQFGVNSDQLVQKVLFARMAAEELLKSEYFIDEFGTVKTYHKKILEVIPCLYYTNCLPVSTNSAFYEKLSYVTTFLSQYEETYKKLVRINRDDKLIRQKQTFEFELGNTRENNYLDGVPLYKVFDGSVNCYGTGSYLEAIKGLTYCIDNDFNQKDAYLYRGLCYCKFAARAANAKRMKDRSKYGNFAKKDFDKSIALGENSGRAIVERANVIWVYLGKQDYALRELDRVINQEMEYAGMALYWKAAIFNWEGHYGTANQLMRGAAIHGYKEAIVLLEKNPLWPQK